MIPCLISKNTVTVIFKAKPFSLPIEDERAKPLAEAAMANDAAKVDDLITAHQRQLEAAMKANIAELAGIKVELRYGHVYINDQLDDGTAARRIIHLHEMGLPYKHLMNFLARLRKNPSKNSVDQLYEFLERNKLPITPDGFVIAFKAVRDDFRDIHSGTMDNSVGRTVALERFQVDDDFNRTCSHGLHVCGESYLPHYGTSTPSRVVLVKVDPADFVAVPRDYQGAKARVCRYEVIDEMSREDAAKYFETRSRVTHDRPGIVEEAELETEHEDLDADHDDLYDDDDTENLERALPPEPEGEGWEIYEEGVNRPDEDEQVLVQYFNGEIGGPSPAEIIDWDIDDMTYDVARFRIVKAAGEPVEQIDAPGVTSPEQVQALVEARFGETPSFDTEGWETYAGNRPNDDEEVHVQLMNGTTGPAEFAINLNWGVGFHTWNINRFRRTGWFANKGVQPVLVDRVTVTLGDGGELTGPPSMFNWTSTDVEGCIRKWKPA